jgi:hypothetical protein
MTETTYIRGRSYHFVPLDQVTRVQWIGGSWLLFLDRDPWCVLADNKDVPAELKTLTTEEVPHAAVHEQNYP